MKCLFTRPKRQIVTVVTNSRQQDIFFSFLIQPTTLEGVSSLFGANKSSTKEMCYRSGRAFCLLMRSVVNYQVSFDYKYDLYNVGDVSSDDEGGVPPAPKKKYSKRGENICCAFTCSQLLRKKGALNYRVCKV